MNIGGLIAGHAASQPDKTAIEGRDGAITYLALDRTVGAIATHLAGSGIVAGDLVGVRMGDSPLHLAVLVAVIRLGAIILPIDWRAAAPEVETALSLFRPRLLISDRPEGSVVGIPLVLAAEAAQPMDSRAPIAELTNAPMAFSLTSGTTGRPKVFRLTHEAYHARVMQFRDSGLILPSDRVLGPVPLAYSAGREMALGLLLQGATFVMLPPISGAAEIVQAANDKSASVVLVSPNTTRALLEIAGAGDERLIPRLRLYINATAKADPEERQRVRERVAPAVADMYGTTGAGLISIVRDEPEGASRTSVGRPGPGITVEIVDEDLRPVATGVIGRIRVNGPGVITDASSDEPPGDEGAYRGWYYPGDIGSVDADGYLHLRDRTADLIKRGGVMIYAQEVEQALRGHPAVVDVAVVGVPSTITGQEVAAFIVARAPLDPHELRAFARQRLGGNKVPAYFRLIDELPRNANGKVLKAELVKGWSP